MDKGRLDRKFWLLLLASPVTLLPFVAGATGLMASWVFGLGVKMAFVSFISCAVSVGIFLTRITTGAEGALRQAMQEMERENAEARNRELQDLRRQLEDDDDSRTTDLLDDLIAITQKFSEGNTIASRMNSTSAYDIASNVEQMHSECINLLKKTLEFHEAIENIRERDVLKKLKDDREKIIKKVQECVKALGSMLAEIYALDLGGSNVLEADRIRADMARNLNIARQVENDGVDLGRSKVRTRA